MISLYKSNLRIDAIVKLEKYFQKGNTQGQQGGGEPKGSSSMVPWKGLGKGKGKGKGKAKLEEGDQTTSKGHKKRTGQFAETLTAERLLEANCPSKFLEFLRD